MLIKKKKEISSCLSFFFSGFGWLFAVVFSQTGIRPIKKEENFITFKSTKVEHIFKKINTST